MKRIKLTQGQFVLVDNEDFEWLDQYKWSTYKSRSSNCYAKRQAPRTNGKRYTIQMSRCILGLTPGDKREADHINHDTLDNRRSNLRVCSRQQNCMNRKSRQNTLSQYKGVSWHKQIKKWQAQIMIAGEYKYLGCFVLEISAALAYNKAAKKLFGTFAYINVV